MLKKTVRLAWLFMFSPSKAAEAAKREDNLVPSLWLLAASAVAFALFEAWKPFDFPDRAAPYPREIQGLGYWLTTMAWQVPLELAGVVLLLALLRWFQKGWFPVKLATAVLWTASPAICLYCYKLGYIGKPLFGLATIILFGLCWPLVRAASKSDWRATAVFNFGINAVGFPMLALFVLAVLTDSAQLMTTAQGIGGIWTLIVGAPCLRGISGLRLPRAAMALVLSQVLLIVLVFCLHMLGMVPKEILKALMPYG